jgi:hypothetical protein
MVGNAQVPPDYSILSAPHGRIAPHLPDSKDLQERKGPTSYTNNHQHYLLQEEAGGPVKPMAIARVEDDLYFLGAQCLWLCLGAKTVTGGEDILALGRLDPPKYPVLPTPWQEFSDFVYVPSLKKLIILDKSGDLFEFDPVSYKWGVFKENLPTTSAPDPEYMAMCAVGSKIALLDPERNQIWKASGPKARLETSFREVLPWRLKAGDINVCDGVSIGYGGCIYVLKRTGVIAAFGTASVNQQICQYHRPNNMRPTRLIVAGNRFFIVERQNNRVLVVDLAKGITSCFAYPPGCDLRGLAVSKHGFWIVSGDEILYRNCLEGTPLTSKTYPLKVDVRLKRLVLPLVGQGLPHHVGVYPGARRLYRYGVHEGLDMFYVPIGTPVHAACDGKIIRADAAFKDMDAKTFNRVMAECRRQHRTSAANEDLFRGCQVWIDHGQGLITRYAHLNGIRPGLTTNSLVKQGDLIGFVGVSGTGQNLPGRIRYPHLHFEIILDGRYLGWGLTPAETIAVYEDVFSRGK